MDKNGLQSGTYTPHWQQVLPYINYYKCYVCSYTINPIRIAHQGVYQCTARTPSHAATFEPVYREMAVLISGPPRVRIDQADANIGANAQIRCQVNVNI